MKTIYVCVGSACHIKGSYDVINRFQNLIEKYGLVDRIDVEAVFCLGKCVNAVSVQLDGSETIYSVQPDSVERFFKANILPMYAGKVS